MGLLFRDESDDPRAPLGLVESAVGGLDASLSEAFEEVKHPRGRAGKWVEVLGRSVHVVKPGKGSGFQAEDRSTPHRAFSTDHLPDIAGSGSEIDSHKAAPLDARLAYQRARSEALAASDTVAFEPKAKEALAKLEAVRGHLRSDATSRMQSEAQDRHRRLHNEQVAKDEKKPEMLGTGGITDAEHRARVQRSLTPDQKASVAGLVAKGATEQQAEMLALHGRKSFTVHEDDTVRFVKQGRHHVVQPNGRSSFSSGGGNVPPVKKKPGSKMSRREGHGLLTESVASEIHDMVAKLKTPCDCGADNLPHEHGSACPKIPVAMLESAVMGSAWDAALHPRQRGGRFAEVLAHLRANGAHTFGHGFSVEKSMVGVHVHTPSGESRRFLSDEAAVHHMIGRHDDHVRATFGKHFMARYTPGDSWVDRAHDDKAARGDAQWEAALERTPGLTDEQKVRARHRRARDTVMSYDRESDHASGHDDAMSDRPRALGRGAGYRQGYDSGLTKRNEQRGGKSKAQSLVDAGLADDLADARAQLADMGEDSILRRTPGDGMKRADLIANRVRGGFNAQDSAALLDDLARTTTAQNLPSALVYQGFASHEDADRAAAALSGGKASPGDTGLIDAPKRGKSGMPVWKGDRAEGLKQIVDRHQAHEIDGHLVDPTTANLLLQVHAALSPENQARFGTVALPRLVDLAWKHAK